MRKTTNWHKAHRGIIKGSILIVGVGLSFSKNKIERKFRMINTSFLTQCFYHYMIEASQLTSASTVAREIICEYIDEIDCLEAEFKAADSVGEPMTENFDRKRNESCRTTAN
jgi:hypothetical protein